MQGGTVATATAQAKANLPHTNPTRFRESLRHPGKAARQGRKGLLPREQAPAGPLLSLVLLDLQLTEQRLEAEIRLVPLCFHGENRVGHVGEIAETRRIRKKVVKVFLSK